MVSINIPLMEFTSAYYAEALEDLIQYLRDQGMDIDESPEEPFVQILRSVALGYHMNAVMLDLVANEMYLPTAKLRDSVAALLALIDYRLRQATPASAVLVCRLTEFLTATTLLVDAPAVFSTRASSTATPIEYEATDDVTVSRTDQLSACYAFDVATGVTTNHTAAANGAAPWSPAWGAGASVGDLLYFGHTGIAWDKLRAVISAAAVGTKGRWEYYDGTWDDGTPDSVINIGTGLRFNLSTLIGTSVVNDGLTVRVRCNATGVYQDCVVYTLAGNPTIDTIGFLGQTIVSLVASEYTIGRDWKPLPSIVDNTNGFNAVPGTYDVDYVLPKDSSNWWIKLATPAGSFYTVRFRVTVVGTIPTLANCAIHYGSQYAFVDIAQGRTRQDNPLASSTGLPSQFYVLNRLPVIDDDTLEVYVTEAIEEKWERVYSLTSSSSTDKHYMVTFDSDSRATVKFGDGVFGKIPLAGIDNIRAVYRTMEDQDGNVGANSIIVNRGGVPYFATVTNPRNASGWAEREGNDETELERAKLDGPESLKTLGRATNSTDIVTLTEAYVTADGSKLFSRCLAIEGTYGPKTVEVVVVKVGGGFATTDELAALELYFNGDTATKVARIIVFNQEARVGNYLSHSIAVTATVYGGNLAAVQQAISTLLQPEAKVVNADGTEGVGWLWEFGEEVPVSMIVNAIMESQPKPRKVTLALPAADVALLARELPKTGAITLTMVP